VEQVEVVVAWQWHDKHVSAATGTDATILIIAILFLDYKKKC
jgi:hypothetical protein